MTTADRIIEAIRINGVATKSGNIRRSTVAEYTARACASSILTPLVPAGTLRWLVHPHAGESVACYAERAVAVVDGIASLHRQFAVAEWRAHAERKHHAGDHLWWVLRLMPEANGVQAWTALRCSHHSICIG